MFFLMGINDERKNLDFVQTVICRNCGRYGRYMVYMTYTVLSLFFIPCIKWNKQYYVQMSCCGKTYRLSQQIGKRIARGETIEIQPDDMEELSGFSGYQNGFNGYQNGSSGYQNGSNGTGSSYNGNNRTRKTCSRCGYTTDEDFEYCPKCGNKF